MQERVANKDVVEQSEEYLKLLNERRLKHAIADISTEMNKVGGGRDYYARLLVDEVNRCMDEYEEIRGANRGEIFQFRYTHDKTLGIGTEEIEIKENQPNIQVFEGPGGERPNLPKP